jgi:hypothetical protein
VSAHAQALPELEQPLHDSDLMPLLGWKKSKFYELKKAGWFAFLEVTPQPPNTNTLYSRHLVGQWLRGELRADVPAAAPTEARRFFRGATAPKAPRRAPGRPRTGNHPGPVLVHGGQSAASQTER